MLVALAFLYNIFLMGVKETNTLLGLNNNVKGNLKQPVFRGQSARLHKPMDASEYEE